MTTRAPLTPSQRARMRRLRERGWTYQRIAERYGVSRQYVHKVVNSRG